MKIWLLEPSVMAAMDAAPMPSAEQLERFMAAARTQSGDASKVMERAGDVARINISGVLTETPDWFATWFGGGNTTYGDISAAILSAETDPDVKSIEFMYRTPGGEAMPVTALADQIAAMKKPNTARVVLAASAGYWLASQSNAVVADNRAAMVGSIGAVVSARKPSESAFVEVTSTNAPNKRPDPETEEGRAAIRVMLDQIEDLFSTAVAVGRDTTVEKVNNDFGRGGMMLAQQALDAGMIDAIGSATPKATSTPSKTGVKTMDLEKLKAEHPGLYASVFAAGKEAGAAQELDRVKYHLTLGKKVGAEALAIEACLEGKGKDDGELMAEYVAAGANRSNLSDRQQDEQQLDGNQPNAQGEESRKAAAAKAIFGGV
jgi:ClpP class serine protease